MYIYINRNHAEFYWLASYEKKLILSGINSERVLANITTLVWGAWRNIALCIVDL